MRSPMKFLLAELQSNKFHPSFGICPWCEASFFYMFDFAFSRSGGLQQRWFVQINAILTKLPQIFYHNFSKLTNILHQKKLESWIWSRFTFLLNLFKKASFAMKSPNAAWLQCSKHKCSNNYHIESTHIPWCPGFDIKITFSLIDETF